MKELGWLKPDENGQYVLDLSPPHYYQVQCQLFRSGKSYCDFVVFAPTCHWSLIIFSPKKDFWEKLASKAQLFHSQCVLRQVVAKLFSRLPGLPPKNV